VPTNVHTFPPTPSFLRSRTGRTHTHSTRPGPSFAPTTSVVHEPSACPLLRFLLASIALRRTKLALRLAVSYQDIDIHPYPYRLMIRSRLLWEWKTAPARRSRPCLSEGQATGADRIAHRKVLLPPPTHTRSLSRAQTPPSPSIVSRASIGAQPSPPNPPSTAPGERNSQSILSFSLNFCARMPSAASLSVSLVLSLSSFSAPSPVAT